MKTHKDLEVWQKAIGFVTKVYRLTDQFPERESFNLTNQIRRAAVSIPSNIAEGAARNSDKEFLQFLYIARASAVEIETQLLISSNLGYLDKAGGTITDDLESIIRMLTSLINRVKQRVN